VNKDDIWVREGVLPDYPNVRAPQFDFDDGQLVVPAPPNKIADIQEPFVREQEIPPDDYHPEGYHPQLLREWPASDDIVIPTDVMPPQMVAGMGAAWRERQVLFGPLGSAGHRPRLSALLGLSVLITCEECRQLN